MEEALWRLTRKPSQENWLLVSKELGWLHQLYMEYTPTKIKKSQQEKRSNLTRVVCFGGFKDSCERKSSMVTRRGCFPPLLSRRYFMDFCTDGNFLQQQDRLWQSHLTEAGGAGLAWTSTRGGEELQLPGPIQIQTGLGSLVWHASRPPRAVCRSSTDV